GASRPRAVAHRRPGAAAAALPAAARPVSDSEAERPLPVSKRAFDEALPSMLVSLLERRYLTDLDPAAWRIAGRPDAVARPLLWEVTGLGRAADPEEWIRTMPGLLTACHDAGHALVMVLEGQGSRCRLHFGGRRLAGAGGRSTEEYLEGQVAAFRAHCAGL